MFREPRKEDIARALGISPVTLWRYESGRSEWPAKLAREYARITRKKLSEVLEEKGDSNARHPGDG